MKIQFCGASNTVTGSCYYIETSTKKILIDCGAFQGSDQLEKLNRERFPFNPVDLDFVFLTHAHYDHSGRLPLLTQQGFRGKIICTQPTRDLTRIVLEDSARLQEEDYKRWVEKQESSKEDRTDFAETGEVYMNYKPLYTVDDVDDVIKAMVVYPQGNSVMLDDVLEFRMRNSGHILGSVSFEFWIKDGAETKKLVFSGDLGQPGQRIIKDPDMIREADYVIVESTYGDRLHRSKDDTIVEMLSILKNAQRDNGNVIIPVFAIERAQEIVYELNLFYESGLMDRNNVYLDSPMAINATDVFKRYPSYYDEDARRLIEKGDDPFSFPELKYIMHASASSRISVEKGGIILAGSGMCTGGRVVGHLLNNVGDSRNHIMFVGFQAKGTLGRRIVDKEYGIKIRGRLVDVKAQIHTLNGFSAHADMRDLKYWLRGFGTSPKKVFIVHGEKGVANAFSSIVSQELGLSTTVPSMNESFEI